MLFPGSLPRTLYISVVKCRREAAPGIAVLVPSHAFMLISWWMSAHRELGHPWMKSADARSPHECTHDIPMGYTFSDPSSDHRDIPSPSTWQCYENLQCYSPFEKTTLGNFPCQSLSIDHCDCVLFLYISLVWARGLKCENKELELELVWVCVLWWPEILTALSELCMFFELNDLPIFIPIQYKSHKPCNKYTLCGFCRPNWQPNDTLINVSFSTYVWNMPLVIIWWDMTVQC